MQVYVTHEPQRRASFVYVERGIEDDGSRLFETTIGDGPRIERVAPGAEPPLYCPPIPDEIATALAEALAPRPVATERHLDDAIAVRDRLLAIVERP